MKVVFATGTEIEARGNSGSALRTLVGKRLANEQINNQADQEVSRREDENEKGPEPGVHTAASGVAINVAEHEKDAREGYGHQRAISG